MPLTDADRVDAVRRLIRLTKGDGWDNVSCDDVLIELGDLFVCVHCDSPTPHANGVCDDCKEDGRDLRASEPELDLPPEYTDLRGHARRAQ